MHKQVQKYTMYSQSITTMYIESKWGDTIINYTSFLPNMKDIRPMTEELPSQSEVGRTNE